MASITKRLDGRWRARYRDADGKEHAKHFDGGVRGRRAAAASTELGRPGPRPQRRRARLDGGPSRSGFDHEEVDAGDGESLRQGPMSLVVESLHRKRLLEKGAHCGAR